MKIVIAMDSFKGSMTSMEAGMAAKEGVLTVLPAAEVVVRPLADGGEGTTDALAEGLGGEIVSVEVSDPLGRRITAQYGVLSDTKTAMIEMAQAAGITFLNECEKNPYKTTSYGVGEMISDALKKGCRNFIIGIGGSATNDGGMGMLRALGYRFFDEAGCELAGGADSLGKTKRIIAEDVLPQLSDCRFQIACDVENPLCGKSGATYVYGPQKGLPHEECAAVDEAMSLYAEAAERFSGRECRDIPGAGAAGGMGFAFVNFLRATLIRGAELVLQVTELEKDLADADVFFTGEGKLDGQTVMGKAPVVAARMAKKHGCRVYGIAGRVEEQAETCLATEFDEVFAMTPNEADLEYAMQKDVACQYMEERVKEILKRYADM